MWRVVEGGERGGQALLHDASLFQVSFSAHFDFALRYTLDCTTNNTDFDCFGRAHSVDFQTRIHHDGGVSMTHRNLMGSISTWTIHGTVDTKNGEADEKGEMTFGVHTNHHDHILTYKGRSHNIDPNRRRLESVGVMDIDGGRGRLKDARGAASFVCRYDVELQTGHCLMNGMIHYP